MSVVLSSLLVDLDSDVAGTVAIVRCLLREPTAFVIRERASIGLAPTLLQTHEGILKDILLEAENGKLLVIHSCLRYSRAHLRGCHLRNDSTRHCREQVERSWYA